MQQRSRQGVTFVQTQPCLNVPLLSDYLSQLVAAKLIHKLSVIVTVPLLRSAEEAAAVNERHGRSMVPAAVVERLAAAPDPEAASVEIAARVFAELHGIPGIAGANVAFPGEPAAVAELVRFAAA